MLGNQNSICLEMKINCWVILKWEISGSREELGETAQQFYSSPPIAQHLGLESLSLKNIKPVPPTPGTVLHNKIQNKIEKLLSSQLHLEIQQQMGVFQASISKISMKCLNSKIR